MPERRALSEFLFGIDEQMFQKRRIELLDVSKDDILKATAKYLTNDRHKDVVFGSADEQLLAEGFEKTGWKVDRFATKVGSQETEAESK